ncbi:cytochrome P450 [Heliocybe sulcata]|uniref:Cytochrome P450 n=1 Tax=Heliocybe sulcata TaxID=5364 RepID=A0A5C3MV91_9AGAM|nr:cytochrome P450 [Heliocybe sulcata]
MIDVILPVLLAAIVSLLVKSLYRPKVPHPPGPKGLPVVGNVLDMPSVHPWETITKWGRTWGDIVYVNLLGQPMVFLNSVKAANDLLEKKSLIYSDRPSLPMACDLVHADWMIGLHRFGDEHRAMRKLAHSFMGTRAIAERFAPFVEQETARFLKMLLRKPDDFAGLIRRTAGAIILRVTYGYSPWESGDPLVELVDKVMLHFSIMTAPKAFLVDIFPILKYIPAWFPGARFKRLAAEYAPGFVAVAEVPMTYVKEQMSEGTAGPSFVSGFLEDGDLTPEKEDVVKCAAGSMYAGGADTTVSSVMTFFLAMTLYPDAQKKAQDEIDALIGSDRLPVLKDRDRLPYVNALVKEVYRWHPIAPLGLPHTLSQDDVHDGYFIPKGTIVVANIWGFLHDPDAYKDPAHFNPDRFMGSKPETDPVDVVFGFGRRICPGRYLAEQSVWLSCAMTLAAFSISKAVRPDGSVIEPEVDFSSEIISHAKPFQCAISPRSKSAEAIVLGIQ